MTRDEDRQQAELLQRAVVEHDGEAFVQACPGAGKTRTLVQRVERLSKVIPCRKGIAILSFTNAAVDEFKKRCHGQGIFERLGFPFCISTFDSFLNQFLVLPFGVPSCPIRPVIVDSWENAIVIPKGGGKGIPLSNFDALTGKIDPQQNREYAGLLKDKQADYEKAAYGYRKALNQKGFFCSGDARQVVKAFLRDKARADRVGKALAARFYEVIVDEAQDCNIDDVAILGWLRSHGIPLVVVCDPDQAIYEFRKGSNEALRTFVQGFHIMPMTGNFRSSKTICAAAGTMRTSGTADMAVGDHWDSPHPVMLIQYDKSPKSDIGMKFREFAFKSGISDVILLAHKRLVAERASGAPRQISSSDGKLARLARLVVGFQAKASTGKQREVTLKGMIRLLMELEGLDDDEILALRPIANSPEDERKYRRKALEVLSGLPPTHAGVGADGWAALARALVGKMVKLPGTKTIQQALPSKADWHLELEAAPSSGIPCATIHEAKGRDYDGVCLVLEKNSEDAVTDWEKQATATSEALRVLYVGATRAKRLLVIALPTELAARVEAILSAGGVHFCKEELAGGSQKTARTPRAKKPPKNQAASLEALRDTLRP